MTSILFRAVRVLDPASHTDRIADVFVQAGRIQAIAPHIDPPPGDSPICDRPGLVLGPGLVDLYSRSGEPGHESRDTLDALAQAAIAGGFTRLTLLPNTVPPVDNPAAVEWMRSRLTHYPRLSVQFWGALTQGLEGERLAELRDLSPVVAGFADGRPLNNLGLLHRALDYLSPHHKPVALWCCDRTLTYGGTARAGTDSLRFGLPGIPAIAETAALSALLECVAETKTPVHLMRVSTARSVDLIAAAKDRGLPITASTPWMHLLWNTTDLGTYDPNLRLDPPLGTPSDQCALQHAVKTGLLDAIAIDHIAYTYEEKTVAFGEAPPGAIGLELALPLLWERFVASGQWDALTLWSRLSVDPARCLQQEPPHLSEGAPVELTVFDPNHRWTVTPETLQTRSHNTPCLGQTLQGKPVMLEHLIPALVR